MPIYNFCAYYSDDPSTMERHSIYLDEPPAPGTIITFGTERRWRVVGPHVPADSAEPEPNTFACEPAD